MAPAGIRAPQVSCHAPGAVDAGERHPGGAGPCRVGYGIIDPAHDPRRIAKVVPFTARVLGFEFACWPLHSLVAFT